MYSLGYYHKYCSIFSGRTKHCNERSVEKIDQSKHMNLDAATKGSAPLNP